MSELIIDTLRREIFRLEQQLARLRNDEGVRYHRQELEHTVARRRRLLERYQRELGLDTTAEARAAI